MTQRDTPSSPRPPRDPLFFVPVVLARQRRDGWTASAQICFVRELARCGSVTMAARSVGRSARSAYALRGREGAYGFAQAWDRAMQVAYRDAADEAAEAWHECGGLDGTPAPVPVRRRGSGVIVGWRTPKPANLALRAMTAITYQRGLLEIPHEERLKIADRKRHLDRLERRMMREAVANKLAEQERETEPRAPSPARPAEIIFLRPLFLLRSHHDQRNFPLHPDTGDGLPVPGPDRITQGCPAGRTWRFRISVETVNFVNFTPANPANKNTRRPFGRRVRKAGIGGAGDAGAALG